MLEKPAEIEVVEVSNDNTATNIGLYVLCGLIWAAGKHL